MITKVLVSAVIALGAAVGVAPPAMADGHLHYHLYLPAAS
jgi:hypothetical protein